tara:strand:- start:1987 stop:2130 length:144 start_codon:yes stop_codon:yes gene_type:complete
MAIRFASADNTAVCVPAKNALAPVKQKIAPKATQLEGSKERNRPPSY